MQPPKQMVSEDLTGSTGLLFCTSDIILQEGPANFSSNTVQQGAWSLMTLDVFLLCQNVLERSNTSLECPETQHSDGPLAVELKMSRAVCSKLCTTFWISCN